MFLQVCHFISSFGPSHVGSIASNILFLSWSGVSYGLSGMPIKSTLSHNSSFCVFKRLFCIILFCSWSSLFAISRDFIVVCCVDNFSLSSLCSFSLVFNSQSSFPSSSTIDFCMSLSVVSSS